MHRLSLCTLLHTYIIWVNFFKFRKTGDMDFLYLPVFVYLSFFYFYNDGYDRKTGTVRHSGKISPELELKIWTSDPEVEVLLL